MQIRTVKLEDYDKLILFWKENYFVSEMDSLERFTLFLQKNPDLSILAEDNGNIVGTSLGSFDGRRGYLQKVVVAKEFRKKGLGKELVENVIEKLKLLSATYIPISVEQDLVHFYENCGFKKSQKISMTLDL